MDLYFNQVTADILSFISEKINLNMRNNYNLT